MARGRTATRPGPKTVAGVPLEEVLEDFRLALVSRAVDDREMSLQKQSKVFFQISGAGHEAMWLALARHFRPGYDWFFPYYRDRALALGLGVTPTEMLLQAVGSADDTASGGRQMPSHWGDVARHIVTSSSATGSQCIPGVGCAEGGRYLRRRPAPGLVAHDDEVTVSLGDGATSQGEFWESLNSAVTLRLPVLYVVADNGYAISVSARDQAPAPISTLVRSFPGLTVADVDGTDYLEVRRAGGEAVAHVRAGEGPVLLRATVTRPYSHSAADTQAKYRTPEELAVEAERDPLRRMAELLVSHGGLSDEEVATLKEQARQEVADAARAALAARRPDPATVRLHLYELPPVEERPPSPSGDEVSFADAIRLTLASCMAADERIRVFGEDVADGPHEHLDRLDGKGGVFGTTHGLQRRFGPDRCFNTPLAEANIVGRAVGQALRGLRPAPEVQFFDYIWTAMQQIKTEAATIRWRSNGTFSCPLVLRVPIGGYLTGGAIWHSQCGESIFAHVPGLLVAFPSRARDVVGLLRYAFTCDDPVLFLEHKHLLRQPYARDPYPGEDYVVPFGKGAYVQQGTDLTIVTYGATVEKSRRAAARLAAEGASVEIVDLRTVAPWDRDLVADSVRKTGRALVVHEDIVTCGFGAEVVAWIAAELFEHLDAPVQRVGALDTPVAYEPTLEHAILPQEDDIAAAARRLLTY